MGIVNQGNWCQATVSTGATGIRKASNLLRKAGYQVIVSNLGLQVTQHGLVKTSLIDVRKGNNEDTFQATTILRNYVPELRW